MLHQRRQQEDHHPDSKRHAADTETLRGGDLGTQERSGEGTHRLSALAAHHLPHFPHECDDRVPGEAEKGASSERAIETQFAAGASSECAAEKGFDRSTSRDRAAPNATALCTAEKVGGKGKAVGAYAILTQHMHLRTELY